MNTTRLQTLLLSIAENNYYKNVTSEWQMNVGLPHIVCVAYPVGPPLHASSVQKRKEVAPLVLIVINC